LLAKLGGEVWVSGMLHYTGVGFQKALWILPICFAVSIVLSLVMRETRCHHIADDHAPAQDPLADHATA